MDLQKLTFPLMIAAAIVGLWVVLRPKPQAQVSNQPSAAASGLPNYLPAVQNYQVTPPQLAAPMQPVVLADPYNPTPGQPAPKMPPPYLAFNFGPGHDLTKVPLTPAQISQLNKDRSGNGSNCGCGGGCGGNCGQFSSGGVDCGADINHGVYPDGRGAIMAKSQPELLQRLNRQDPSWLDRAAYNLQGSDVQPQMLPLRSTSEINQMRPPIPSSAAATSGVSPAAPASTYAPGAPGADSINAPVVKKKSAIKSIFNSNAVVNTVGSVDTRLEMVGTNLFTFGQQVPKLGATTLQRLVRVPMAG